MWYLLKDNWYYRGTVVKLPCHLCLIKATRELEQTIKLMKRDGARTSPSRQVANKKHLGL
jgi:hypothetical protein